MSGAPGAATEHEAAQWVRGMFGRVAPRYDLLNHLLSFNFDRSWRARTTRKLRAILHRPGFRALDLCCGTGDLLIALEREAGKALLGADFCHPMLVEARRKAAKCGRNPNVVEADALVLPFPDASLDLVTSAFGFRNLSNYEKGLAEIRRVLRPGGVAAILEFSQPQGRLFGAFYRLYSARVLPAVGRLISGDPSAYTYLPESVRKFPAASDLASAMRCSGFSNVEYELMTGGIVALHTGERKP